MPRVGDIYSKPAGTTFTPNTVAESAKVNAAFDDLVQDANTARPIVAGGTGANTAVGANDKLNTTSTDIAAASTVNLANATGVVVNITGTTTITSLGTVASGALRTLVFGGILTLTHNGTSLILPGGANITTAAGDVASFRSKGSGNWVCVGYMRASGQLIVNTLTTPTLTLKQSASPAPTAEGDIQWDTDDNRLVIGDGAGQKTFSDDSKLLPLTGGTLSGAVSGITPTNAAHLTRKDYVDGQDIGIGQSWQAPTRNTATVYQNTTGKPIMVNIAPNGTTGAGNFDVSPDNSNWTNVGLIYSNSQDVRSAEAIVPAGHYYRLSAGAGIWRELR